ncbi:Fic family protein [Lactococcus lactis]|uniref:Fic family protein n=1 Tax=Lactococcus lactis TaxID=1358 RepID=UPI00117B1256|nr:Fic family protein [Lactococcus lactis]TRW69830.1 cell filamentation protein Fic [Lactococcus lactis]
MSFDEERPYQVEKTEYSSRNKLDLWETAFGLQKTDGLEPSEYMVQQAQNHIDGKASYQEVEQNVKSYYVENQSEDDKRFEEADISSLRIFQILAEEGFSLSPVTLLNYHKRVFQGIESFRYPVGGYRTENITKTEPVLNGKSVEYASASMVADNLDYDFEMEKNRDYSMMTRYEIADQVMKFVSGIWQTHPFREGNTRTSAVFLIKYLRHMGFEFNNEPFKKNSKFFRDALVLANAATTSRYWTDQYLKWFTDNLLFEGTHELVIVPFKG